MPEDTDEIGLEVSRISPIPRSEGYLKRFGSVSGKIPNDN